MFDLAQVVVCPVVQIDERRLQHLMQEHHYLGASPKISETIWYVATFGDTWVALEQIYRLYFSRGLTDALQFVTKYSFI